MIKNDPSKEYDLIVIGGGASGMMAAGTAGINSKKVLLIEKNAELGKKLKITGGGRCNITNATFDNKELLKKFGKAEQFLYSPFSQFSVKDTFDFFKSLKLELITEPRNRVFPITQKASDVFDALNTYIDKENITILKNDPVIKINLDEKEKTIISVETKKGTYYAKNFIIATGGKSHPETGSTGDGFLWLKKLGHTVKDPTPDIVPLKVSEKWAKKLSGTSLPLMKITFYLDNKKSFSETGRILFTHFGISGPLILNSAKKVKELLYKGLVTAKIDCYPNLNESDLEKNILKIFDNNKNKSYKNILKEISPAGLNKTLTDFDIVPDLETKVHSITKEQRKQIVKTLKSLPLTIEDLMGMDKAVVSDGGVPLTEIETKTMKSKIVKNLYLTGDILDINRPSGGYSLQLCWTTGYIAGQTK